MVVMVITEISDAVCVWGVCETMHSPLSHQNRDLIENKKHTLGKSRTIYRFIFAIDVFFSFEIHCGFYWVNWKAVISVFICGLSVAVGAVQWSSIGIYGVARKSVSRAASLRRYLIIIYDYLLLWFFFCFEHTCRIQPAIESWGAAAIRWNKWSQWTRRGVDEREREKKRHGWNMEQCMRHNNALKQKWKMICRVFLSTA